MNTIKVPYGILAKNLYDGNKHDMDIIQEFEDFIFDEFVLVIEGYERFEPMNLYVSWIKDICSISFYHFFENTRTNERLRTNEYLYSPQGTFWDGSQRVLFKTTSEEPFADNESDYFCGMAKMILFYMGYIMNYPRKRRQERIISHKYSKEHRISTSKNKIYLFDDILKYVSDNYIPEGGHHDIQCPCWEVRGHYRHYKNGNVVFIKSYKKGKQKDTATPKSKEYYV